MHISDLRPTPGSVHKKKRVGRGNASGKGTTGGRGTKGQQSRSGRDLRIGFEGGQNPLVRSLSRKRGFNNKWRTEYEPINVSALAALPANSEVTPASLREAGIVKSTDMAVKILGDGEISVALNVSAERVSASARAKIEAAGGKATELAPRVISETGKKAARRAAGRNEAASVGVIAEASVAEAPSAEAPADEPAARPARRAPRAKAEAEAETETETKAPAESTEEEAED